MSKQAASSENKMGTMPINKLLLTMSIPIIISMTIQALYNIVDSIFVGQLSEDALNAVSLAFPVQNLIISVAVGTGVGINALLSRRLGEGRQEEANQTAMNGIFLALVSGTVFAVLGVLGARIFYTAQTDIGVIVDYGEQYVAICCLASVGICMGITMERLLQATGRTMLSMIVQGAGAITNIVLDPIFIFGLFGFPRMEVTGAALATISGQLVSATLGLYLNIRYNHDIHLSRRGFRPSKQIISDIYQVGIPSIIMSSVGSVMVFGMNKILISFTATATAVLGIYFKLQSFVFMPVFGLCNGMVPIVAFNFGARRPDRIVRAIALSILYAVLMMTAGFVVFQMATEEMISLFQSENSSGNLLTLGIPALQIVSLSFVPAGFSIISSSAFQALGHGVLSLVMSVVRQLVVLLPVAVLFARLGGLDTVWWSFPLAEVASFGLTLLYLRHIYKKEIQPLSKT